MFRWLVMRVNQAVWPPTEREALDLDLNEDGREEEEGGGVDSSGVDLNFPEGGASSYDGNRASSAAAMSADLLDVPLGEEGLEGGLEGEHVKPNSKLGVLDIFGFEVFDHNSFEQLCINYANEKLQQHFTEQCFKEEVALYDQEGISFEHTVTYQDNSDILRLFEHRTMGLLPLLDEEARLPQGSTENYVDKILERNKQNDSLERLGGKIRGGPLGFVVNHYSGRVEYEAVFFMAKNKDLLQQDVVLLMSSSTCGLVGSLYCGSSSDNDDQNVNGDSDHQHPMRGEAKEGRRYRGASNSDQLADSSDGGGRQASSDSIGEFGGRRRSTEGVALNSRGLTISSQLRHQLKSLMVTVRKTHPHFIKCIKSNPHSSGAAGNFDSLDVFRQLRCCGVIDAISIRKRGFPFRYNFNDFIARYTSLGTLGWRSIVAPGDLHGACQALLASIAREFAGSNVSACVLGKTRVLFRENERMLLDSARFSIQKTATECLGRWLRGYLVRNMVRNARRCEADLRQCMASANREDTSPLEAALVETVTLLERWPSLQRLQGLVEEASRLLPQLKQRQAILQTLAYFLERCEPVDVYMQIKEAVALAQAEEGLEDHELVTRAQRVIMTMDSMISLRLALQKSLAQADEEGIEEAITMLGNFHEVLPPVLRAEVRRERGEKGDEMFILCGAVVLWCVLLLIHTFLSFFLPSSRVR